MGDVTRVCRMCGEEFIFTEGEQAFYLERGYRPPLYCPSCRDARRSVRSERQLAQSSDQRARFTATCSSCGRETTVPFKPDPARPILCDDCFAQHRSERSST